MTAYKTQWAKSGCKIIRTWKETIASGSARGVGEFVEYADSKGNLRECLKWVVWEL